MLNVYLNNGTLFKFRKGKPLFENGKLHINSNPTLNHNFDYEKDLKEVYKVEECTCRNEACIAITQRIIYRGELLKRGVEVTVKAECSINKKGEIEWIYY